MWRPTTFAAALLPNDQRIGVINIHLDYVRDDTDRFKQAEVVKEFLRQQKLPWILLGDFNDTPESRTLELFRSVGTEVSKAKDQRFTFSSDDPKREIDYLFVGPTKRWQFQSAKVISETTTSDHLPVVAELILEKLDG